MFRPLFWPSSERFITKGGYIDILRNFVNLRTEIKYKISKIHGLKYTLKQKISVNILVVNLSVCRILYVASMWYVTTLRAKKYVRKLLTT
jgi:hypothetical protein